ncbi:MAG TPA: ABC transporter permease [Egibacteraceae bacterium]|nr:ABC transporter permease [Egibacteraceae bacterium]
MTRRWVPRPSLAPGGGLATGWLLWTLAAGGLAVLGFPLAALVARVRWAQAPRLLTEPAAIEALRLSLVTSGAAVAGALVLGVPLAWILARARLPGRGLLQALVLLPMVLPPVVAGVGLLAAFGRSGALGAALQALGIRLPFTTAGAALAQAVVAAPFLIISAQAGFASSDRGVEDAAATLGASRWLIWRAVTLPAVAPSLLGGIALCWARALGEFGATITFAGSLRGRTQTLPLAVHELLQTDPDAAFAVSALLLAVSLVLIVPLGARLVVSARR